MPVPITSANGFVGRALAARLLDTTQLGGRPIARLSLLALAFDDLPVAAQGNPRALARAALYPMAGDMADTAWLRRTLSRTAVDVVFHFASIPGGTAEQQYGLARRVNAVGPPPDLPTGVCAHKKARRPARPCTQPFQIAGASARHNKAG